MKRRKLKKGYAVLTVKDVKINKPEKFTATFKSSGKIQPEYFEHFELHFENFRFVFYNY